MKRITTFIAGLIGLASLAHADTIPDWLRHPAAGCSSTETIRYLTPGARATCGTITFAELSGKPTTLAGYGITNGQVRVTGTCGVGNAIAAIAADGTVTCQAAGGGGAGTWGSITGTLSAQTDLQTALDAKVPVTRTVNGHALSANVTVTAADVGAPSGSGTSSGANTGDQDLSSYLTSSAAAAAYQPLDSDLTAIAALTTTSYGRSFLPLADASAGRTLLGLGTLATQSGTFSGTSSGTNTGDQTTITGNAGTATALAANGSNCSAGSFPLGVDASGASESCTALPTTIAGTANQITASGSTGAITLSIPSSPTLPGTTTGTFSGNLTGNVTGNVTGSSGSTTGNAATATALAANPTDCSASQYATTIAANGNLTCATIPYSDLSGPPQLAVTNAGASHNFLTTYTSTTGLFTKAQPACADISDAGSGCTATVTGSNTGDQVVPANTTSTASNFFTAYNSTTGAFTKARPACADLSDAGSGCSSSGGSGTVTTTGSPASGNLAKFSGTTSIVNGDLSGDCTTSGTLAITCTKTSGSAFATGATTATGTSGATIPLLNGTNTWSGVQSINSGDLALKGSTSGTITLNAAATAGSNTLTLPAGTTNFSSTGGTSQVVKQTSSGGAFTVARLACADLSDAASGCSTAASGSTTTTTLGADTASISFTSISGSFNILRLTCSGRITEATGDDYVLVQFNNDTGSNYDDQFVRGIGGAVASASRGGQTSSRVGDWTGATSTTSMVSTLDVVVQNYAGTTFFKNGSSTGGAWFSSGSGNFWSSSFQWRSTSAINRVDLIPAANSLKAGTSCTLVLQWVLPMFICRRRRAANDETYRKTA